MLCTKSRFILFCDEKCHAKSFVVEVVPSVEVDPLGEVPPLGVDPLGPLVHDACLEGASSQGVASNLELYTV